MLFNKKIVCKRCGKENPAKSTYCGGCGELLSSSSVTLYCPSCGTKVRAGDTFCGSCGARLSFSQPVERTVGTSKEFGKDRVWIRNPGDFAQRFEIEDIKGFFAKKVTIEQGTKAIFLQGGVYKGFLPAGVYNLGSVLNTISGIKLEERATIILADAADVQLTFQLAESELRARNGIAVSASGTLTVYLKYPRDFLENYLKGEKYVSLADLERMIHNELRFVAQQIVSRYDASELYGNSVLAGELAAEFQNKLNESVRNRGVEISGLNCVGFDEGAWKEVLAVKQRLSVETEKLAAEYEGKQAVRQMQTQDASDQLSAEYSIASQKQRQEHDLGTAALGYELERDGMSRSHQREQDKLDFAQDLAEISALSDLQARKRRQKIEDMDSSSIETRILMNGGTAEDVQKLEQMKRAQSLTPEQILALQTTDPRAAGEALAARAKLASVEELSELRIRDQQAFNQMMQTQYREHAEQMKEVLNTALGAMGQTATARATAQNPGATVVSGGIGTPVVVQVPPEAQRRCPFCSAVLSEPGAFCTSCGRKIE